MAIQIRWNQFTGFRVRLCALTENARPDNVERMVDQSLDSLDELIRIGPLNMLFERRFIDPTTKVFEIGTGNRHAHSLLNNLEKTLLRISSGLRLAAQRMT